jgi:hypothetical protein
MKASHFVFASAGLFAAWLTVTYLRAVPPELYPVLGKGSTPVQAKAEPKAKPLIALDAKKAVPVAEVK